MRASSWISFLEYFLLFCEIIKGELQYFSTKTLFLGVLVSKISQNTKKTRIIPIKTNVCTDSVFPAFFISCG